MISIRCFVADFNVRPIFADLSLAGRPVGSFFLEASNGVLDLKLDWLHRGALANLPFAQTAGPGELLQALSVLLGTSGAGPNDIGLLITNAFRPDTSKFGVMFDLDAPNGIGPRRGCAIFLDRMGFLGLPPTALLDFAAFTAIHEIGHAFNLWHTPNTGTIMEPFPNPTNLGSLQFELNERMFLSQAANPNYTHFVLPGLNNALFNVRPLGIGTADPSPFEGGNPSTDKRLALKIGLSHNQLWSFEPLELDVELKLKSKIKGKITVPQEIDPGHESFQLWITAPNGERVRYRSQTYFCPSNSSLEITAAKPFRRDISIFRDSNGYTFRAPGRYAIQAAFRLRSGKVIWSNVTYCEILPAKLESPIWRTAAAALQSEDAIELLRFKKRASGSRYRRLVRFADKSAQPGTAVAIHYCLGTGILRLASGLSESKTARSMMREGMKHLTLALEKGNLSPFRRTAATNLIAAFEKQAIGRRK